MHSRLSRLFAGLVIASATLIGTAGAQPDVRDHRDPKPDRRPRDIGPREAPPPPKPEAAVAPRAGYVWIVGRWNWKGGKYEWMDGRWERERAGKRWRDGRWDRKGDTYVFIDGGWGDDATPPPGAGPRDAPPTPREERQAARAGYVWIPGRWDWKGGKWDWQAGRWERERAGKRWREGRWDKKGDTYAYVDGEWIAGDAGGDRPREAPPTLREEKAAARAGFVWVKGRWDWKGGKWEWMAGRFERERAGKKWREARWEQRDGAYNLVDGDWEDAAGVTVAVGPDRPRREWRLERPVVSSYWPIKGKPGSRIVIRGRNFPNDAMVVWGNAPILGARVKPTEIVFEVPKTATTGTIAVRTVGGRRDLAVGAFEVAAAFDAEAEARKLEDERRRIAEAAWVERQKALAKDRAAREAEMNRRQEERAASRERRRSERIAELRARFDRAFLADPETQDELTLHAQRVADMVRMREVAELSNNGKLVVRVEIAQSRENERHAQRMAALKASFGTKAGTP